MEINWYKIGVFSFVLLILASLSLSIYVLIDGEKECATAGRFGAVTKGVSSGKEVVSIQQRAGLYVHPTFELSLASPLLNKILSIQPSTGDAVAGVRSKPYVTVPVYGTYDQTLLSLGGGVIAHGQRTSASAASFTNFAFPDPDTYQLTAGVTASTTQYGPICTTLLYGTGLLILRWNTTTTDVKLSFRNNTTGGITDLGSLLATSTASAPTMTSFIQITTEAAIPSFAFTYDRGATVEVFCFTLNSATTPTAFTTLSNKLTGLGMAQVSAQLRYLQLYPTSTDLTFKISAHEVGGRINRYTLVWGGTTTAPTNNTFVSSILTDPEISPVRSLNGNSLQAFISDDTVLLSMMSGHETGSLGSVMLAFNLVNSTFIRVTSTLELESGVSEVLVLAHDRTDDTMILTWISDVSLFKIGFASYDPLDNSLTIHDVVTRDGVGAIVAGCLVDKETGHYVLSNYYGQVMPIWVSGPTQTVSFRPDIGRKPVGYIDGLEGIYAPGMIIALPESLASELKSGASIYTDETGDLRVDGVEGQDLDIGYFLGDINSMFLKTLNLN